MGTSSASRFCLSLSGHLVDCDANTRLNKFTRLLNMFWPGSITQVDRSEDGILRRSNVTTFLDSCSAKGFPPEDLFLPDDLTEGTSHGLTRVAGTIIALVKWAYLEREMLTSTWIISTG